MSSELENSGIRVAVCDCNVTVRRRWRPPYQTGKTVHVHAKHYKRNEDGCTALCVCGNGFVPLSHSGNVVTRIGIDTYILSVRIPFLRAQKYKEDKMKSLKLFSFVIMADKKMYPYTLTKIL